MSTIGNDYMRAVGEAGRKKGLPSTLSQHEVLLGIHLKELGYADYEREYKFHPKRRWRFDFAVPRVKLAIEVNGGIWTQGRHTRGAGFQSDMEKKNEAVLLGWRLFEFSVDDVRHGLARDVLKRFKP